jgi:signal transduction histidine kinase
MPVRFHRLYRSTSNRMIAGVCGGLAHNVGVDPLLVRVAMVALVFAGGTGLVLYVLGWILLPAQDTGRSISQSVHLTRDDTLQLAAIGMLVLGGLLLLRAMGLWFNDKLVWPFVLAALGLVVIWRQAEPGERASIMGLAGRVDIRSRRLALLRLAAGTVLVASGVAVFLATQGAFGALRQTMLATAGIVVGVTLVFGPWWWRLGKDLAEERRGRIRSEERAEMAAHLHDSVLQTLALIQRNSGDPKTVVGLARRQERALRGWLHGAPLTPVEDRLSAAIEQISAEVEELHGVAVDDVTVGDCEIDERLAAMVAAAREALVNAATWSGESTVAVYAEAEGDRVSIFVRDRGKGFDLDAVGDGHHGIAESIRGRMARHGGKAEIRTSPGEGTEVELVMTR